MTCANVINMISLIGGFYFVPLVFSYLLNLIESFSCPKGKMLFFYRLDWNSCPERD